MIEIKRNTTAWVPVRLLDGATPVPGAGFGSVTCAVMKADGTESAVTVTNSDWDEATTGALSGSGTYRIRLDSSHLNVLGFLTYAVSVPSPAVTFVGSVSVVENIESDVVTLLENDVITMLTRALGLMHENSVLDNTTYDGQSNLSGGRLRIYDSKANATAAGATGLVSTYTITATHAGKLLQTYRVVLEP